MSIVKKRLSPEESRSAALEAARHILIEMGPAAVTLKAVAARIDRTHANLLHHFGSAAGLQKALAAYQAETVCATIGKKMAESPPGERNVRWRQIIDTADEAGFVAKRTIREGGGLHLLPARSLALFQQEEGSTADARNLSHARGRP